VATNLKIFTSIKGPNFMQNFQIVCRLWKHVNSAKHRIAFASKTVTGLYGSSTVSYHQCKWTYS